MQLIADFPAVCSNTESPILLCCSCTLFTLQLSGCAVQVMRLGGMDVGARAFNVREEAPGSFCRALLDGVSRQHLAGLLLVLRPPG